MVQKNMIANLDNACDWMQKTREMLDYEMISYNLKGPYPFSPKEFYNLFNDLDKLLSGSTSKEWERENKYFPEYSVPCKYKITFRWKLLIGQGSSLQLIPEDTNEFVDIEKLLQHLEDCKVIQKVAKENDYDISLPQAMKVWELACPDKWLEIPEEPRYIFSIIDPHLEKMFCPSWDRKAFWRLWKRLKTKGGNEMEWEKAGKYILGLENERK